MIKMNKNQDERVILEKRKIASEAFVILLLGLLFSVLIQQFVFRAPFSQYAVEWILFIVVSLYLIVRNIMVGNNLFGTKKRGQVIVILNSLICGLTVAGINTTLNVIDLGFDKMGGSLSIAMVALITFLSAGTLSFFVLEFFYQLNEKKQKKIDALLNQEEDE